ncbi:MAG: hypothetical protein KC944_17590 [Candidatus Omnitrophica bacterium]|nr:hypothetical protein [Candidatus Omnitrophota bacterium]MCA9426544.1 hypothetical protein [Candidatus Omnitrophota bacterium]MCA9440406.1 hypothetical protein [Candidatus Omnitrophota bacterium]
MMQKNLCFQIFAAFVLIIGLRSAEALLPPQSKMAAPPVVVSDDGNLDPTWVTYRGQVLLVLYVGKESEIPQETVDRVNEWQSRLAPKGFQAVVIHEGDVDRNRFSSDMIVVKDDNGETRRRYQIVDEREYFVIDRNGRLHRDRINEAYVQNALSEYFDPSWVGFSGSWNQSVFVHRNQYLMYLADTIPDTVTPGETIDLRLIALPTFSVAQPGREIHSPIQVEVRGPGVLVQEVYKAEEEKPIQVSTEMPMEVQIRSDAEEGFHPIWVKVRHNHCGFGDCGFFEQEIPIPVWVE